MLDLLIRLLLVTIIAVGAVARAAEPLTILKPTGPQPTVTRPQGGVTQLYSGSYALVISSSNYLGRDQQGWDALPATKTEMDQLASVLQEHGFEVWRVTDASSHQLRDYTSHFFALYGRNKDNRLLYFFSGHGYTDKESQMGYLVPIDSKNPKTNPTEFDRTAIPISEMDLWARRITARHAVFFFDSCFSGSIFTSKSAAGVSLDDRGKSSTDKWLFFTERASAPFRQFVAAGGPDEELPPTSQFVPLLLNALKHGTTMGSGDGYVTAKELGLWIEHTLPNITRQRPHADLIRDSRFIFGDMVFQIPQKVASTSSTTQNSMTTSSTTNAASRGAPADISIPKNLHDSPPSSGPVENGAVASKGSIPPGNKVKKLPTQAGYPFPATASAAQWMTFSPDSRFLVTSGQKHGRHESRDTWSVHIHDLSGNRSLPASTDHIPKDVDGKSFMSTTSPIFLGNGEVVLFFRRDSVKKIYEYFSYTLNDAKPAATYTCTWQCHDHDIRQDENSDMVFSLESRKLEGSNREKYTMHEFRFNHTTRKVDVTKHEGVLASQDERTIAGRITNIHRMEYPPFYVEYHYVHEQSTSLRKTEEIVIGRYDSNRSLTLPLDVRGCADATYPWFSKKKNIVWIGCNGRFQAVDLTKQLRVAEVDLSSLSTRRWTGTFGREIGAYKVTDSFLEYLFEDKNKVKTAYLVNDDLAVLGAIDLPSGGIQAIARLQDRIIACGRTELMAPYFACNTYRLD